MWRWALAVSECEPAKKLGHLAVFLRPQDHVPVIGHQTVSQQADWRTAHRCNHNPLERGVIFGLVKKLAAPIGAVKSVVNYLPGAMRARLGMSNAYIDLRYLQFRNSGNRWHKITVNALQTSKMCFRWQ
jgi:hypothetical protein